MNDAETGFAAAPAVIPTIDWQGCRFEALSVWQLQFILQARQQVFGIEQNCVYLDIDGVDGSAHHLAAWSAGHRMPLAYARVVDPGVKYDEPSIGRVLTTAPARGRGLGRELVQRAIGLTQRAHPGRGIRISAQSRLEAFYASFGFVVAGPRYLEDGLPHTEMWLAG